MMTKLRTIDEIDEEIRELNERRREALDATKKSDLELVRKLCKQHGFTATNLRGVLATKGKKKIEREVAEKKPAAKKAPAKKTAKTK